MTEKINAYKGKIESINEEQNTANINLLKNDKDFSKVSNISLDAFKYKKPEKDDDVCVIMSDQGIGNVFYMNKDENIENLILEEENILQKHQEQERKFQEKMKDQDNQENTDSDNPETEDPTSADSEIDPSSDETSKSKKNFPLVVTSSDEGADDSKKEKDESDNVDNETKPLDDLMKSSNIREQISFSNALKYLSIIVLIIAVLLRFSGFSLTLLTGIIIYSIYSCLLFTSIVSSIQKIKVPGILFAIASLFLLINNSSIIGIIILFIGIALAIVPFEKILKFKQTKKTNN